MMLVMNFGCSWGILYDTYISKTKLKGKSQQKYLLPAIHSINLLWNVCSMHALRFARVEGRPRSVWTKFSGTTFQAVLRDDIPNSLATCRSKSRSEKCAFQFQREQQNEHSMLIRGYNIISVHIYLLL